MAFDSSLPHQLPWNYPWIKDEIERRDEYIAQLEAELAHQKPQNAAHGAIDGESVKVPAEDESVAHSEPDSREMILADLEKLTQTWHDYDGNFMRIYSSVAYAQVKELLDRQESITRRECDRPNWDYCETCETLADVMSDNLWMHERIAELKSQLDTMRDVAREFRDERDRYRAALGKAIDCADEIRRLS